MPEQQFGQSGDLEAEIDTEGAGVVEAPSDAEVEAAEAEAAESSDGSENSSDS